LAPVLGAGDKVMQVENQYDKEVYNGDIGTIDDVDPAADELTANFDGRTVIWRTRHVGAGLCCNHSQEPRLQIPSSGDSILTQHYAMLQRNLLYTWALAVGRFEFGPIDGGLPISG
jgi:exodeoxyribonuclease V alpha subunit